MGSKSIAFRMAEEALEVEGNESGERARLKIQRRERMADRARHPKREGMVLKRPSWDLSQEESASSARQGRK